MTRTEKPSDHLPDAAGADRSEAEMAIDEINQAAKFAEDSLLITASAETSEAPVDAASGSAPAVVQPQHVHQDTNNRSDDREAQVQTFIRRAAMQKKRGREELARPYAGLSVSKDLKYNDVNIASSAERFLGLIDLALYTINRRGPQVLGADACDEILARFDGMVRSYSDASTVAKLGAGTALKTEKDGSFGSDWLQPEYTKSAFECTLQAKHRLTTRLVDALYAWDSAIHDLSVLEWNGKMDSSQVAQTREEERRGLRSIYSFAAKSLAGMRNRTNPLAKRSERPAATFAANDSTDALAAA